jgi:hypothetical protein
LHTGHPEVFCAQLAKPTKLLNVDEIEITGDALATHGGSATARALYFFRTGDLIDRRVLHRIVKLCDNASLGLRAGQVASEAGRLVAQMRGDPSIDYLMFYHESDTVGGIASELGLTGEAIVTGRLEVTDLQQTEIENVRAATRLSPQSHVLLSVTWVRREERMLFRCNPSVLFIGFTANTNLEKKPFFMGTGVTATNEGIVAFRALTPNEKLQWTDNIMAALPRLLGQETFRKVSIGIGDKCGNEIKCVPRPFIVRVHLRERTLSFARAPLFGHRLRNCHISRGHPLRLSPLFSIVKSWMKGGANGSHRAVCRLCGLCKIHFGIHEKAFASRFHNRKTGSALVAEFAAWHVWFCRECESESEERFGRAAHSVQGPLCT